jgi:hypothetical protein
VTENFQAPTPTTEPQTTGHPGVDQVLAALPGLDAAPVAEHVTVFEQAHDRLRAALGDTGGDASGT